MVSWLMAPGLGGRAKGPEHRWLVFAVLALVPWGNEPGTNVPWAFDMGLKRPLCCRRPCTCNGNGPAWQSIAARAEGPCGTRSLVPPMSLGQRRGGDRLGVPWGGQGQRGWPSAQRPLAVGLPWCQASRADGFFCQDMLPESSAPRYVMLPPLSPDAKPGTAGMGWDPPLLRGSSWSQAELSAAPWVILNNSERGQVMPWPTGC